MQAIILAAGKGERMRPLTFNTPKPLLRVRDRPLIEHHIKKLADCGVRHIVINVSWLHQQIINHLGDGDRFGVRIKYSIEQGEPLETGGGILKALPLLNKEDTFLVINGDIFTDFDFASLTQIQPTHAHLVLVNNPEHHPDGDFSILKDSHLLSRNSSEPKFTYSGMGVYSKALFKDQSPGKFKLAPLLKQHMDLGLISGQHHPGQWQDVGTVKRLNLINSEE